MSLPPLAIARSGLPSPFRSPMTTDDAASFEGAVAAARQHGDRRPEWVRGSKVEVSVAVQIADRDRSRVLSGSVVDLGSETAVAPVQEH